MIPTFLTNSEHWINSLVMTKKYCKPHVLGSNLLLWDLAWNNLPEHSRRPQGCQQSNSSQHECWLIPSNEGAPVLTISLSTVTNICCSALTPSEAKFLKKEKTVHSAIFLCGMEDSNLRHVRWHMAINVWTWPPPLLWAPGLLPIRYLCNDGSQMPPSKYSNT